MQSLQRTSVSDFELYKKRSNALALLKARMTCCESTQDVFKVDTPNPIDVPKNVLMHLNCTDQIVYKIRVIDTKGNMMQHHENLNQLLNTHQETITHKENHNQSLRLQKLIDITNLENMQNIVLKDVITKRLHNQSQKNVKQTIYNVPLHNNVAKFQVIMSNWCIENKEDQKHETEVDMLELFLTHDKIPHKMNILTKALFIDTNTNEASMLTCEATCCDDDTHTKGRNSNDHTFYQHYFNQNAYFLQRFAVKSTFGENGRMHPLLWTCMQKKYVAQQVQTSKFETLLTPFDENVMVMVRSYNNQDSVIVLSTASRVTANELKQQVDNLCTQSSQLYKLKQAWKQLCISNSEFRKNEYTQIPNLKVPEKSKLEKWLDL